MSNRKVVSPPSPHALYRAHNYAPAVQSGDLLFISGQVGSRPDGTPEPDFEAQVRLAFSSLETILKAAGGSFEDLIDVTTFHTDAANQLATVMEVRNAVFGEPRTVNWTAAGVTWLSGFDFEIKAIARIP